MLLRLRDEGVDWKDNSEQHLTQYSVGALKSRHYRLVKAERY